MRLLWQILITQIAIPKCIKQKSTNFILDRGLSKEEEFGLGGLNMDGPITRARSKRFQEELNGGLNSLIEEREEEVMLIYFSQLLE